MIECLVGGSRDARGDGRFALATARRQPRRQNGGRCRDQDGNDTGILRQCRLKMVPAAADDNHRPGGAPALDLDTDGIAHAMRPPMESEQPAARARLELRST